MATITEITVSYGQTQSLPEYCNVKPMLTLRATLTEEDDPGVVRAALMAEARAFVEAEIDAALERHDQPARYDSVPRFEVYRTLQRDYYRDGLEPLEHVVAIIPKGQKLPPRDWHQASYSGNRGLRYLHALRIAAEYAEANSTRLIDCADGDLSRLPARPAPEHQEGTQDQSEQGDEL